MRTIVIQPWITTRGATNLVFRQDAMFWIDVSPYKDIVFFLDCRESSGGPTLFYETAPAADENLFLPMGSLSLTGSATISITRFLLIQNAAVPLAAFVRWRINGTPGVPYDATFRILACVV